jgi:tetratricopeptide (TPR) repeat protein
MRNCLLVLFALAGFLQRSAAVEGLDDADRTELLDRLNPYAWLLATDQELADGSSALANAKLLAELGKLPDFALDTIAACHARAGDYAEAVKWLEQAIKATSNDNLLADFIIRKTSYQAQKPFTAKRTLPAPAPLRPVKMTFPDKSPKTEGALDSDGSYVGHWRTWFANGKPESEGSYWNSSPFGKWKRWYQDGSVREEGEYFKGCRIGAWKEYHPNGQLLAEGMYLERKPGDNRRLGTWTFYYDNGKKAYVGGYAKGKRSGTWITWNNDGSGEKTRVYRPTDQMMTEDGPGKFPVTYMEGASSPPANTPEPPAAKPAPPEEDAPPPKAPAKKPADKLGK